MCKHFCPENVRKAACVLSKVQGILVPNVIIHAPKLCDRLHCYGGASCTVALFLFNSDSLPVSPQTIFKNVLYILYLYIISYFLGADTII